VGLRQQIDLVPVRKVVEQVKPQPPQVVPISRSPALQLPVTPHAVSYWTSPAPHVAVGTGVGEAANAAHTHAV
jgi:hypothetical protein